ncbi:MAG: hypothetical protein IPO07_31560 [Haliscomenobacter sp.]|nr:hypothetical protein [Haliscomenobacter sp.]MBK9492813.1 hypothetical protein [Haliscomenobacter sp.]
MAKEISGKHHRLRSLLKASNIDQQTLADKLSVNQSVPSKQNGLNGKNEKTFYGPWGALEK